MGSALILMVGHDSTAIVVLASIMATWSCAMMLTATPNIVLQFVDKDRSGEATGLSSAIMGVANRQSHACLARWRARVFRAMPPLWRVSYSSRQWRWPLWSAE
jgi:hypothetical protein